MSSKRLLVATIVTVLALPAIGFRSPQVRDVGRPAMCNFVGSGWKDNSLGQDPCAVVTALETSCLGGGSLYTIRSITGPADTYHPPQPNMTSDLTCECDTVTYSLYMACSSCQGGSISSWTTWSANCNNVTLAGYPHTIPQGTAIPRWAFYDITSLPGETYNDTVAMAIGDEPEETPGPSPLPHKKKNIGAIVGGVVGGVVLCVLVVIVVLGIRRRRRNAGGNNSLSQPSLIAGVSQYNGSGGDQNLLQNPPITIYNPDDPSTFPPPLAEDVSTITGSPHG